MAKDEPINEKIKVKFSCNGHKNILGTHKTTFEFTKDNELSLNGNCIIGIDCDFDLDKLKKLLEFDKLKITIKVGNYTDSIVCDTNKKFDDKQEIVIRLGTYDSERTLGVNADKAGIHLNRDLIKLMKDPEQKMFIEIEGFNDKV